MTTDQEPLMTGPEAFAYIGKQLHVHPSTARRYARGDVVLIPTYLPSGAVRYNPEHVRAFIDQIRDTSKATG